MRREAKLRVSEAMIFSVPKILYHTKGLDPGFPPSRNECDIGTRGRSLTRDEAVILRENRGQRFETRVLVSTVPPTRHFTGS